MDKFELDLEGNEIGLSYSGDSYGAKIWLSRAEFYSAVVRPWLARMVAETDNKIDDAGLSIVDGFFNFASDEAKN